MEIILDLFFFHTKPFKEKVRITALRYKITGKLRQWLPFLQPNPLTSSSVNEVWFSYYYEGYDQICKDSQFDWTVKNKDIYS